MPIRVADITGRENVVQFIDIVKQLLDGNRTVQFVVEGHGPDVRLPGDVTAIMPDSVTITAKGNGEGVVLQVGKPYIAVRKSIGKGNIDAVSLTPDRIDISLRGLPDVSIGVQP